MPKRAELDIRKHSDSVACRGVGDEKLIHSHREIGEIVAAGRVRIGIRRRIFLAIDPQGLIER